MQIKKLYKWLPCIVAFTFSCGDESTNPVDVTPVSDKQLVVTEIMYNNGVDSLDFIEIKNVSSAAISLAGMSFSEGITYTFPATASLEKNSYYVLTNSAALFAKYYPAVTPNGIFTGSLSNSGEIITISTVDSTVISVVYGSDGFWPSLADGTGYSLVAKSETSPGDQNDYNDWLVSTTKNGTPGKADSPEKVNPVYVNEVLISNLTERTDQIELYNPSSTQSVDISYWYLTDKRKTPKKYCIPANTVIAPNSYKVFAAAAFKDSIKVTTGGGSIYLYSAKSDGTLTGFSHGVDFEDTDPGASSGLVLNSDSVYFVCRLAAPTLGAANAQPLSSPVVISEIMYHPATVSGTEFVEIMNISNDSVPLFTGAEKWKIEGISFDLPSAVILKKGGVLLLVDSVTNVAAFRQANSIDSSVIIMNFKGSLSNNSEVISIKKPGNSYVDTLGFTIYPYVTVDAVEYQDKSPWPKTADGDGFSLTRRVLASWGNDPANWRSSDVVGGTPGK